MIKRGRGLDKLLGQLPFLLTHDGICRLEDGKLYILDRRKLPFSREYVMCETPEEAAKAIKDMVTQGGGPLEVALAAMVLADQKGFDLVKSAQVLASSRPTNRTMKKTLQAMLERRNGKSMENLRGEFLAYYDDCYLRMSVHGASLIPDGAGILTTCFPEHSFMLSLLRAKEQGKDFCVYVPETRPYLQGAHLTAPALAEVGIKCRLVTDAMPAHYMARRDIDLYMTASDLFLSDGRIVNKTGTLENAIAASYYGIDYYPFSLHRTDVSELELEYRSGDEVRRIGSQKITSDEIECLYPAFDIVPSSLVKGVITPEGVVS